MPWQLTTAIGLIAFAVLVIVVARWIERFLMYAPTRERVAPAMVGLPDVQELEISTEDGNRVIAWYAKAAPGQPTVLYFHGNGGSLANRSDRIRKYAEVGRGVFMMTYRGYGGSTGSPSERVNVSDAKAAYDRLVSLGVAPDDIILYGESIGTGVAVQVAVDKPVAGLILDAPYTSILDVAQLLYPYLPSGIFLRDRYETKRYIGAVKAPLLVVHGEADEVIPVRMGRAVYELANEPKQIATFRGARHSDHGLFGSFEAIQEWIDRLRPQSAPSRARAAGGRN
ncbi:MAG: alpha/beta hydrolase [Hyphomicrobiaceae bacterium]